MVKLGEICWLEIPVKDTNRAISFYREVFGWDCRDEGQASDEPGVLKTYFFGKGNTHGCFLHVEPQNFLSQSLAPKNEDKERWALNIALNVDSVDAALPKIEQAGGTLYR